MKFIKYIAIQIKNATVSTIFLIFTFTVSILMISFSTSFLAELKTMQGDKLNHIPPNALVFQLDINSDKKITAKDIISIFKTLDRHTGIICNSIMVNVDKAGVNAYNPVSAEWFQGDTEWKYPLNKGRYYEAKEIEEGKKVVLVGKSVYKYTEMQGESRFIEIFGEKYRVIGLIGNNNKSLWDNRIFMPITSLPKINKKYLEGGTLSFIIYNSKGKSINEVNKLLSSAKSLSANASISKLSRLGVENLIKRAIDVEGRLFLIVILVYIIAAINAVNTVSFWIENRKFEIGLRKAIGHNNIRIANLIFGEMFSVIGISCLLALIIQGLISSYIHYFGEYPVKIYLENIVVGVLAVLITSVITSIYPIYKAIKISPIRSMNQ